MVVCRLKLEAVTLYKPQHDKQRSNSIVNYHGVQIEPWNHPASIANRILNYIQHTYNFGCQFIAPMGHGKTTAMTIIAHHIHLKDPRFKIIWAEASDFQHLKRFLATLPKEPMIIIFDDITGALKQMTDKEIEANFETLTKIRWIIDPATGKTPTIIFVAYHYSKNLEKEFRAVLGMSMFLAFGPEEHTNIDTIMPAKTPGRSTVEYFSSISDKMFTRHEFSLMHSNGQIITYKTDFPCRASCAVIGKEAQIILASEKDQCVMCTKRKYRKYADPEQIVLESINAYGPYGKKALKMACAKRGYLAYPPKLNNAISFVEDNLLTRYDVRFEELVEKLKDPKTSEKAYRKRKNENIALENLEKTATLEEIKTDENKYEDDDIE